MRKYRSQGIAMGHSLLSRKTIQEGSAENGLWGLIAMSRRLCFPLGRNTANGLRCYLGLVKGCIFGEFSHFGTPPDAACQAVGLSGGITPEMLRTYRFSLAHHETESSPPKVTNERVITDYTEPSTRSSLIDLRS